MSRSFQQISVRVECADCGQYLIKCFRHQVTDGLLGLAERACHSCKKMSSDTFSVLYTFIGPAKDLQ